MVYLCVFSLSLPMGFQLKYFQDDDSDMLHLTNHIIFMPSSAFRNYWNLFLLVALAHQACELSFKYMSYAPMKLYIIVSCVFIEICLQALMLPFDFLMALDPLTAIDSQSAASSTFGATETTTFLVVWFVAAYLVELFFYADLVLRTYCFAYRNSK